MATVVRRGALPHEFDEPLYRQAVGQLDQALPYADIDPGVAELLRLPERSLAVQVPVKLDDGSLRVFPGYRVQHSTALGPTKGGIRYNPAVSLGECAALAMWMTWKCSLLGLPYGGAKGGVACVPRELSRGELERITRRYTAELMPIIGPQKDVPAPDMATDEQTMAWFMDTYSVQVGHAVPEIVTGKPISIGGSAFRPESTGYGVVVVVEEAVRRLGWSLDGATCIVQGFGKVGGVAADELAARGARVVAVSDVSGGIHRPEGLDLADVHAYLGEQRALAGYPGAAHLSNAELLALPCDVLVLAALEDQVTGANADSLRTRLVAEGANGPVSLDGDAVLNRRGIPILPDVLTNAGGVTVSYFEWVQDIQRLFWGRDEIRERLSEMMREAFDSVWRLAEQESMPLRLAALVHGIRRVAAAVEARGIYP